MMPVAWKLGSCEVGTIDIVRPAGSSTACCGLSNFYCMHNCSCNDCPSEHPEDVGTWHIKLQLVQRCVTAKTDGMCSLADGLYG